MTDVSQEAIKEIQDRCRRMETRLTRFLEAQGFETGTMKPSWHGGVIKIPSPACSLKDMLAVVPDDWSADDEITVTHKGEEVMGFFIPER